MPVLNSYHSHSHKKEVDEILLNGRVTPCFPEKLHKKAFYPCLCMFLQEKLIVVQISNTSSYAYVFDRRVHYTIRLYTVFGFYFDFSYVLYSILHTKC